MRIVMACDFKCEKVDKISHYIVQRKEASL